MKAKPIIFRIISNLNLSEVVGETALKIYKRCALDDILRGRSMNAFIAASIYAATRIHYILIDKNKLAEFSNATSSEIRETHKIILPIIMGPNFRYKPIEIDM